MRYEDQKVEPSRFAVIRFFGFDQFVPEKIVTSHWVSSKTFFAIRFIVALYSTVVLWTDIGVTNSGTFFQFFTTLTFVGLHAYLITSCVHHFRYLISKKVDFLLEQPAFINYLYMYLYSTVITFNIVTPVVFWAILAKNSSQKNAVEVWMNVSVHGVSFFLMMSDVIFNRMRLSIRMVVFPLITIILFMLMAFVIYAVNGYWVYPFLDWTQGPKAAIWYIVVGVICVLAFFIQMLIHWLRDFIARKLGRIDQEELTDKTDTLNRLESNSTINEEDAIEKVETSGPSRA